MGAYKRRNAHLEGENEAAEKKMKEQTKVEEALKERSRRLATECQNNFFYGGSLGDAVVGDCRTAECLSETIIGRVSRTVRQIFLPNLPLPIQCGGQQANDFKSLRPLHLSVMPGAPFKHESNGHSPMEKDKASISGSGSPAKDSAMPVLPDCSPGVEQTYGGNRVCLAKLCFGKSIAERGAGGGGGAGGDIAGNFVVGIQARVKRGTTAQNFDMNDETVQKLMSSSYVKSRGFPQYWNAVKYRLRAHVATFGTPTWFLTLNPNVKGWTDLHGLYSKLTGEDVDKENIEQMIAADPTIFSRYWKNRVAKFWRLVLLSKDGPLGEVTNYFYRTEYQHRGTQHIHCVLWTKNRPNADAKPSEVAAFIDQFVTARKPNEKEEPELYKLVTAEQTHWDKHSKTCVRTVRVRGKVKKTKCRFAFPRPLLRRTLILDPKKTCKVPGVNNWPYYLARTADEQMINDYNPTVLLGWGANIDLQYIPIDAKDVVNYITGYTTKGEKAKKAGKDELKKYALSGMSAKSVIFNIGLDICNQREVGLLEVCDDLLGHENFEFDTAHVFIQCDPKDRRARVLKPKAVLEKSKSGVVHEMNWMDDYYRSRDKKFELMSLYNMMTNFEVVTISKDSKSSRSKPLDSDEEAGDDDDDDDDDGPIGGRKQQVANAFDDLYHTGEVAGIFYGHPDYASGDRIGMYRIKNKAMRKMKQKVVRFFLPKLNVEDVASIEEYYRRLSVMFIPWRDEDGLLSESSFNTYAELWKSFREGLQEDYPDAFADLNRLLSGYCKLQQEEAQIGMRMDMIRKAKEGLEVDEEGQETIDIQERLVNQEKHDKDILKLNTIQREIFDKIISRVEEQNEAEKENENIRKENEERMKNGMQRKPLVPVPEPLQLFVSGVAGTGKSFLINTISDALTLRYCPPQTSGLRPAVLLDAPTGMAALGINGNTIHSLMSIEVTQADQRAEEKFEELAPRKFDSLKELFKNVRLLITDEISMVSNIMLMKKHKRLAQISGREQPFGGYNVVLFGDLLQIPPVRSSPPFLKLDDHVMNRVFGTINSSVNLWECLDYEELTQNMRQGDELELSELFDRIRIGAVTDDDVQVLAERMIPAKLQHQPEIEEIADFFLEIQSEDRRAMALFATNAEVNLMNFAILRRLADETVTSSAVDVVDDALTSKMRRMKLSKNKTGREKIWQSLRIDAESADKQRQQMSRREADGGLLPDDVEISAVDRLMHGGLPAVLTFAIGSRVMLRRNLAIADRLVNGATGTVVRTKEYNGKLQYIYVLFDGSEEEKKISRLQARFRHNDDIMIRYQFPLVLAYAATIHKAQGLTLRNVIVHSHSVFSAGMFYVAVSRVTNKDGLHLAGFDPSKIMVNSDALAECNRLRRKIGLPELVPKALGGDEVAKLVPSYVVKDQVALSKLEQKERKDLVSSVKLQRIVYDLRNTNESVLESIPIVCPYQHLQRNRYAEAVINSLINILSMMEHVANAVKNFDVATIRSAQHSSAVYTLQKCLEKESADSFVITNMCGPDFHENSMAKIVEEFFFDLILPKSVFDIFSRKYEAEVRCKKCKKNDFEREGVGIIWINHEGKKKKSPSISKLIEQSLTEERIRIRPCDNLMAGGGLCNGDVAVSKEIGGSAQYLIVGQQEIAKKRGVSKVEPVPVDGITIRDKRFLLIGAVRINKLNDDEENAALEVETWRRLPQRGWIYSSNGEEGEEVKQVEWEDMNFFVFVDKPKQRMTESEKRRAEQQMVVEDIEDIFYDSDDDGVREVAINQQDISVFPGPKKVVCVRLVIAIPLSLVLDFYH